MLVSVCGGAPRTPRSPAVAVAGGIGVLGDSGFKKVLERSQLGDLKMIDFLGPGGIFMVVFWVWLMNYELAICTYISPICYI